MAFDSLKHGLGAENFPALAGEDLTGAQYKAVQLTGTGVRYAVDVASGRVVVCYNTPSSGQAVTAYGAGHVVKAKSGGALTPGAYVTITGSSTFTSVGSPFFGAVGNVYSTGSTTSGDIVSIRLIY